MSNGSASDVSEKKPPAVLDSDDLIDEILRTKGPAKYKDGLSEENWEEEFEQIPLFMTKFPDKIDPVKGAGILALQDLKFQEDDPDCRALAYKEDGNELFKQKKYKEAITAYSEGLKQGSTDDHLMAVLYCNRAASHYHIGNMRSSILDATKSKSIKQDHLKAYIRGAEANNKLGKNNETITWCEEGLTIDPVNSRLKELRTKATQEKRKSDRDKRKRTLLDKETKSEQMKLYKAIKSRRIRLVKTQEQVWKREIGDEKDELEKMINNLSLTGATPISKPVHLNEQDQLVWPVTLLYPEYGQSEVILEFNEESQFVDHIQVMFGAESAPWDLEQKYTLQTIEVWYEELSNGNYKQVPLESTLANIINGSRYTVVSGTPSFIVLAKGSKFRETFLHKR